MSAARQWTWRHNRFIAEADATTERAEAEAAARTYQEANPGNQRRRDDPAGDPMDRTR